MNCKYTIVSDFFILPSCFSEPQLFVPFGFSVFHFTDDLKHICARIQCFTDAKALLFKHLCVNGNVLQLPAVCIYYWQNKLCHSVMFNTASFLKYGILFWLKGHSSVRISSC